MRGGGLLGRRRAQVAVEYLFIMGFALLLITPLIVVYYDQANRLSEETTAATIERAATQIVEAADTVYYLGSPSMRTITIDLPDNTQSVTIQGRSVTFLMGSSHGTYEHSAWSVANLTGGFANTVGQHLLVLTALSDNKVNITERS
ncbi:hypothetical protein GOV07_01515 [Candidatus Woesearchaeota archaeon]|nr:hypothetical protein [Candidatus Woesearchaeota archaeon]